MQNHEVNLNHLWLYHLNTTAVYKTLYTHTHTHADLAFAKFHVYFKCWFHVIQKDIGLFLLWVCHYSNSFKNYFIINLISKSSFLHTSVFTFLKSNEPAKMIDFGAIQTQANVYLLCDHQSDVTIFKL